MSVVAAATVALIAGGAAAWAQARRLGERAARVAHEVRGPLVAVQLALHGAARRGEVQPRLLAALELELRRAAQALADPLGGREPAADVDLVELLACQVRTWEEVARAHGARVVLRPGPVTAVVRADALRIAQATSNLVANAIEHGGGTIEVGAVTIGDRIRVEVIDGGPGLSTEVVRSPRGDRRRGRGLAITAGVLARWEGRLLLLPSRRGARVAIELPAARAPS